MLTDRMPGKCKCGLWILSTFDDGLSYQGVYHSREVCRSATEGISSVMQGVKHDAGKPPWHLLPWKQVAEIVEVLRFGATKYAPHNWKKVEGGRERYFRAAIGHLTAWWGGERLDPESKLPHLAHAGCCVLFLMWFDSDRDPNEDKTIGT